jgi:FkbM family methyltransferase
MTMGANSLPRRLAKHALRPLLNEDRYSYVQCAAKAWDIWRGTWHEPEIEIIPHAVAAGDTVLDLGANFGLYCYHLSRAVGPTGKVWAFEPVPFTCTTCRRVLTVMRLENVELVPKGCADKNEDVIFSVPLAPMGTLSAGQAYIGTRDDDQPGKETQVRWTATREVKAAVVRLDDFLPPLADVSFLKIDVEGAETFAFRGATKLLDKHVPTIVCEINPFFFKGFGLTVDDLIQPLLARGYDLYHYDDNLRKLVGVKPANVVEDNYVFVHARRRDRLAALL